MFRTNLTGPGSRKLALLRVIPPHSAHDDVSHSSVSDPQIVMGTYFEETKLV